MEFEWDPEKDRKNQKKHGVKFEDAVEVFRDEHRIEEFDDREDYGEDRVRVLGLARLDLLLVVMTERGDQSIPLNLCAACDADRGCTLRGVSRL